MIIGAVIDFGVTSSIMTLTGMQAMIDMAYEAENTSSTWLVHMPIAIFGAMCFVIVGGICTFMRRAWMLCFVASILILPTGFLSFAWMGLLLRSPGDSIPFFSFIVIPASIVGLLPLVFVCLRKREWESR